VAIGAPVPAFPCARGIQEEPDPSWHLLLLAHGKFPDRTPSATSREVQALALAPARERERNRFQCLGSTTKAGYQSPSGNAGVSSISAVGPEKKRRLFQSYGSTVGDPPLVAQ
jgi:hypothetical protein